MSKEKIPRVTEFASASGDMQELKVIKGEFLILSHEWKLSNEYGEFVVLKIHLLENKSDIPAKDFDVYTFSAPIVKQIMELEKRVKAGDCMFPFQAKVQKKKGNKGTFYTLI